MEWIKLTLPDGRAMEAISEGAGEHAFVSHGGTPSAATPYEPDVASVTSRGLRFVTFSRPGYAGSDPKPGRRVADVAADVRALLDALGIERFVTAGFSGGGPHALACAALLPGRCAAAASLAGVAPYPAEGLDWLAGMGPENVEEFGLSLLGEEELVPYLLRQAADLAAVQPDQVVEAFGGLVSEVDRAALTGDLAVYIAESLRRAVSSGIAGWRDDDIAFVERWGFELESITTPVAIWQGAQDRMVPFAHGEWLASRVPRARVHLHPSEGHLSLRATRFDDMVDDLLGLAGFAA